ncbi:hypothetical protein IWW37_005109 [Coemansia sp. RSA 2050]|nr:hypothetical protein IWW37_005109 [Coemansia sp. RSA 2050]
MAERNLPHSSNSDTQVHWHSSSSSSARHPCTSRFCFLPRSASVQPTTASYEQHSFWSGEMRRSTKRRATFDEDDEGEDNAIIGASAANTLSMLASISSQQQQQQQQQQKQQQQPAAREIRDVAIEKSSSSPANFGIGGGGRCTSDDYMVMRRLTFDEKTALPPQDIVDELMSHNESEFNLVSKVLQPKALRDDYVHGRLSSFLLLTIMANNAMFSTHPDISRAPVAASRVFIDKAKAFVPDALEAPTISNCLSLLLLSIAYMHQGMLDVSNHYSSMSLRILHQLGVYKIDDNAWSDEGGWITESWLEREQIRRVIWGSFTVDTFLALMLHCPPNILVDLSGVNRPCAQNVWYVGNDSLESLSMPASCGFGAKPGDSAYLATLKQLKLGGVPWRINGTTVQLNFAVLGNALLRSISDPQTSQAALDLLVSNSFRALNEWLSTVPEMPSQPTLDEIHHTLMISSAAMCLKSVVTPYLVTRSNNPAEKDNLDLMLVDYVDNACQVYRYTRLTIELVANKSVPVMFIAYSTMITGGIFAACAHSSPTEELRERFARCTAFLKDMCRGCMRKSLLFQNTLVEIERVEEMVQYLPRRLDSHQLLRIRDLLIPRTIEAAVGKRFSTFINPIRDIARMPPAAMSCAGGGNIPLTSNLCAIFGQKSQKPKDTAATAAPGHYGGFSGKLPDCKLSYTAISSVLVALSAAARDESFFKSMLDRLEDDADSVGTKNELGAQDVDASMPSTAQSLSPPSAAAHRHARPVLLPIRPAAIRSGGSGSSNERPPSIDGKPLLQTATGHPWMLSEKVDSLNIRSRSADADLHKQPTTTSESDGCCGQKSKLLNLLN